MDGAVASAGQRLRAGQRLSWERPPWDEPEAPVCTAVLYEDADLLAVAKPRGLPTLPGRRALPRVDAPRRGPAARPRCGPGAPAGARHLRDGPLRPDPGGRGWACRRPCGSGASARSTGRSARVTRRPTPSPSTRPSARSPTRPPGRSTRRRRAAGRRGAWSGSWNGAPADRPVVAPRGGDRDRPPPPDPHPPRLRGPPARRRSPLRPGRASAAGRHRRSGRSGLPPARLPARARPPAHRGAAHGRVRAAAPAADRWAASVTDHGRHAVGAAEGLERHLARPEPGGDGHRPEDEHGPHAGHGEHPG